ncbi:hypothetical protein [Fodinibius salsisoli]|uniref:DUF2262 domain-containing protein n=1 Tax=Fodinibius salsisoli TaxID=2820877 RepID=A0ABT3PSA0_9BACT|nr:hypothetical protein [Fodinibius salsisoli]MCW9708722.1 hypothetical protein [Fodinibius salsisoli]
MRRGAFRYAVRTALKKVRKTPVIQTFLEDSTCVISLSAGDIDEEIILDDIKFINGKEAWKRVEQESTRAMEASALASDRWEEKLEQERENPPTTNLTIDDFAELIEQFKPEFMEMDGGVFVKRTYDYPLLGDSESEALANRFKLMELLKSSAHYEELDRLYGYFKGVNFSEGDLLPTLCDAFVEKLGNRLKMAFGDRSFKTYMVVDRSTLYHFTFCTERDDGYKFPRYCEHSEGGVERVIRLP